MIIDDNWIYFESNDLPKGITLQGLADLLAPHFGGDNAMHHYVIRDCLDQFVLRYTPNLSELQSCKPFCSLNGWGKGEDLVFPEESW